MKRVVIVGAGFAGYFAARRMRKQVGDDVEVVLLNPHDYFLYVPLLPHVMSGTVEPRRLTVSIATTLRGVRCITATVTNADLDRRAVSYRTDEGHDGELTYDHLVITSGSVTKLLPVPGVMENALGFRDLGEAVYLRDHIIRQVERADSAQDPDECEACLTFVVVGAGYTGTEVAAHGARVTRQLIKRHPRLKGQQAHWLLLDTAPNVLPGLNKRLGRNADRTLRRLGVDVRMGTSVKEATHDGVHLTDDTSMGTRSLVWCVGVRPEPLVTEPGLKTDRGRVTVEATLQVPGHPEVWACGDAAAVPDLTTPGAVTTMTAQHAERQGTHVARNIAGVLAGRQPVPYKHKFLGFVVDLGGASAVADPLNIPIKGFPAAVVTRGYHLVSMPGNRLRTVTDWTTHALQGPQEVQLGLAGRPGLPPLQAQKPTHG